MCKQNISVDVFNEAVKVFANTIGRELTPYEYKNIYYTLSESPTDKDFKFIIMKYSKFYNYSPNSIEVELIIDIFGRYGLNHIDLDKAFKIRIQQVLAKSRDFPTPSELIVLIKPEASINIYNDKERLKALDSNKEAHEIKAKEAEAFFISRLHK